LILELYNRRNHNSGIEFFQRTREKERKKEKKEKKSKAAITITI
jgi:hypothetical protein